MARRWAVVIGAAATGATALGAQGATAAPTDSCVVANGELRASKGTTSACTASGKG